MMPCKACYNLVLAWLPICISAVADEVAAIGTPASSSSAPSIQAEQQRREQVLSLCVVDDVQINRRLALQVVYDSTLFDKPDRFDVNTPASIRHLQQLVEMKSVDSHCRQLAMATLAISLDSSEPATLLEAKLWDLYDRQLDEAGKVLFLRGLHLASWKHVPQRMSRLQKIFSVETPLAIRLAAVQCVGQAAGSASCPQHLALDLFGHVLQCPAVTLQERHEVAKHMIQLADLEQLASKLAELNPAAQGTHADTAGEKMSTKEFMLLITQ